MPDSIVTINQYATSPSLQVDASSTLEVRGWYSRDFVAGDGVTPMLGNSFAGEQGPYYTIGASLNDSGEVLVDTHDVQATTLSNPRANYFEGLWVNGTFSQLLMPNTTGATGWQIPTVYGAIIAFDEIATYNRARRLVYAPNTYFTADQTITEIRRIAGDQAYAAVGVAGITEADTAPAIASRPIAVMINSPQANPAGAVYWAVNYSSFAAAVTAMGTTVPVRLIVSEQMAVGVNVTVTPNIQLQFIGNGKLVIGAGFTATIQGPLAASANWIFDVSASGAVVSLAGNNTSPQAYVQWWGVKGDGSTDDTAALQSAIDGVPSTSGDLKLTRGLVIKVTSTIKFWGKSSMNFGSDISMGSGSGILTNVPIIIWYGTDGGLVIDISRTRDSIFSGFMIFGNHLGYPAGIATGADKGIWLNQTNSPVGGICTSNIFRYVDIYMGTERTNATAVYIADPSNSNLEFMLFDQCIFNVGMGPANPDGSDGWGSNSACVNLDGSFNTKGIKFRKCTYLQANWAIKDSRGSFTDDGAEATYLNIMYEITENSDPVYIQNGITEAVRQVLVMNVPNSPIILTANNYQGTPDTGIAYPIIDGLNGGMFQLIATGNFWGDFRLPGGSNNPAITNVFRGNTGYGALATFQNNIILGMHDSVLKQNYSTFPRIHVDDGNGDLLATNYSNGLGASTDFLTTTALQRQAIAIQGPTINGALKVAATNSVFLADATMEFIGLPNPNTPDLANIGVTGATTYNFAILALDANGNRTMRSPRRQTGVAANTLTGSNYVKLNWTQVPGDAGGYDIINSGVNGDDGPWQLVTHVASGVTAYNVVTNPAGAFTYVLPTYNETMTIGTRGAQYSINIIAFPDGATTPSVKRSNVFKTVNTGPTTITNFTQGVDGQQITVVMRDANTTIANGGSINTRSGADIVPAVNRSYSFVREGGVWVQLN